MIQHVYYLYMFEGPGSWSTSSMLVNVTKLYHNSFQQEIIVKSIKFEATINKLMLITIGHPNLHEF
jgi:hypothetical protein